MDLLQSYSDDDKESQHDVEEMISEHEGEDVEEFPEVSQDNISDAPSNDSDNDSDDEFGPQPMKPPADIEAKDSKSDHHEDDMSSSPSDQIDKYTKSKQIPISSEVTLVGHNKPVTCISIEPAGNRLVTGSLDYYLKLFDFGGMDLRHRAFQSLEAEDGQPIISLSHSPSGDKFVVGTASPQPKIFDRDGKEILKFVMGDKYLWDATKTKGHTNAVTCVQWHPDEKNLIITSSKDGTIRVWDILGEATPWHSLCFNTPSLP